MPHKDKDTKKKYHNYYYLKKRITSEEEALNNFITLSGNTINPVLLTTRGFNSVSKISVIATTRLLKISWCELLIKYSLFDELYNYIKTEYINFYETSNNSSVSSFVKQHKYITQDILKFIGNKKLKSDCGFQFDKYSNKKLEDNFNYVKNTLGHLPTHKEFKEVSPIIPDMYYKTFGTDWDKIVEMFAKSQEEIKKYYFVKNKRNIENGKNASKKRFEIHGLTLEELEDEFRNIFEDCFAKYGTYPSRRYFNKISKFNDITYRKRFKIPWSKITENYGYQIKSKNISERIVLESFKKLLNSDYAPQKNWDWLIGAGGGRMYCDGYFCEYNLVIEFDGSQHRIPVKKFGGKEKMIRVQENDALKNTLLLNHGISIIRIASYSSWHDLNFLKQLLINNMVIENDNAWSA